MVNSTLPRTVKGLCEIDHDCLTPSQQIIAWQGRAKLLTDKIIICTLPHFRFVHENGGTSHHALPIDMHKIIV